MTSWKEKIVLGFMLYNAVRYCYCMGEMPSFVHGVDGCVSSHVNGCNCIQRPRDHYERPNTVQCCCFGDTIRDIKNLNLTTEMHTLIMKNVWLTKISGDEFVDFPNLETIDISDAKKLLELDVSSISQLTKLKKLSIQNCPRFSTISGESFHLDNHKYLLSLTLRNNALTSIPKFTMSKKKIAKMTIDLSRNKIASAKEREIQKVSLKALDLSFNRLKKIEKFAFNGSRIMVLKLSDNRELNDLDENAFAGMKSIIELDLSRTSISLLPHRGLGNLEYLLIMETHSLKKMPDVLFFRSLKVANLTYPYHCCYFKHVDLVQAKHEATFLDNFNELSQKYCVTPDTTTSSIIDSTVSSRGYVPVKLMEQIIKRAKRWAANILISFLAQPGSGTWGSYASETKPGSKSKNQSHLPEKPVIIKGFKDYGGQFGVFQDPDHDHKNHEPADVSTEYDLDSMFLPKPVLKPYITPTCRKEDAEAAVQRYFRNIKCYPTPNALNPCEDITGHKFLRISIWFVWLLAIFGNLTVLTILLLTRHRTMRVHYFLMANLATADLCTGLYLGMLAVQDVRTAGKYYNYAVSWQTGFGCKMAGFLSVFASELSIVTMFLISFDAWYNTRYAFYHKTFRLKAARTAMAIGWIFALTMASLPLVGVSDYSVTSTCLPLDADSVASRVYIMTGLVMNVLAFVAISAGYMGIYCMINQSSSKCQVYGGNGRNPEDIQVAKKMGVLIVTDFVCWAPTIFFGMTAAAGQSLISISVAKFFLVICYPLNAFANPFLYVFITKVFRKDMSRLIRKNEWLRTVINNRRFSKNSTPKREINDRFYYQSQPPGLTFTLTENLSKRTSLSSSRSTLCSAASLPRGSLQNPGLPPRGSLQNPGPPRKLPPKGVHRSSPTLLNVVHQTEVPPLAKNVALVARPKSPVPAKLLKENLEQENAGSSIFRRKCLTQIVHKPRNFLISQLSDISEHSHSNSSSYEDEATNYRNHQEEAEKCREPLLNPGTAKGQLAGNYSNSSTKPAHSRYMPDLRTVVEEEKRRCESVELQPRIAGADSAILPLSQKGQSNKGRNVWRRSSESSQSSWKTASSSGLSSDGSQNFGGSQDSQFQQIRPTALPPSSGRRRRHSSDRNSLESGYSTSYATTPEISSGKCFDLSTIRKTGFEPVEDVHELSTNTKKRVPIDVIVTRCDDKVCTDNEEASWV